MFLKWKSRCVDIPKTDRYAFAWNALTNQREIHWYGMRKSLYFNIFNRTIPT
jgi:hypothetical protein